MPSILDILYLILAGAIGGFLSGVFGVGGGIIFIPILDLVLSHYGVDHEIVKFLLANSMMATIFTGTYNTYKQYKARNFFPKYILATAVPGMLTALASTWFIQGGDWYSKRTFSLVFAAALVPAIIRMLAKRHIPHEPSENIPLNKFSFVGFFTGIFSAFSGLGGGMVMIPAFVNVLKMEMKKAVSISAGTVPFFAFPTALYYMFTGPEKDIPLAHLGYIVYPVVFPMILGIMLTVPLGVRTGHKMKPVISKTIFAMMGILIILKTLIEYFSS